jgi:adenylate cyclase
MSHETLISPIREWLIDEALGNPDIVELFEALCMRISSVGIPITRARLFWPTLHPLFQAETVMWDKGEKAWLEQFVHQDEASDAWKKSPLKYLIEFDQAILRRELSGTNKLVDFELLEGLEENGFTDFIAMRTKLEGTSFRTRDENENSGIMITWATNSSGGFSDNDVDALSKLNRRFAVTCKVMIQSRISSNIAQTYLGTRAGGSVLDGQIRRGDGQTTNAVIWYSDLRDSTQLAETLPSQNYFDLLNAYFTATAQPIIDEGGEILDFIGDAVLGIFPYQNAKRLKRAVDSAHKALISSCTMAEQLNIERRENGLKEFNFGIGINIGEVMFGNIGVPSRLAFSVIGPAVNEAARIEALSKVRDRKILAGKEFANFNPEGWQSLGEQKLKGVATPIEVFEYVGKVS